VGIGQLGMTEDEFWGITPRAFFNAVEGFESLWRTDKEIQRLQTFRLMEMWASKPIRDLKKLWIYPWETEGPDRRKELAQRAMLLAAKFDRIEKRHGYK